jgi:hypothetical protein
VSTQDKTPTEPVTALTRHTAHEPVPKTAMLPLQGLDLGALLEFSIGLLLIFATALAAIPALLVVVAHPLGPPLVAGGVAIALLAGAAFCERRAP